MSYDSDNWEVGYGRPPEHTRFKPGQSGNKKGRPKGTRNTYTILREILNQKMTLKENDRTIRISKKGAMLMHLVNKGVKGDMKALSLLFPHLLISDMKEEERKTIMDALNQDDKVLLHSFLDRINRLEDDSHEPIC